MDATDLLVDTKLLPVIEIEDADLAAPLANCLLDAGIGAIEITLRTQAALKAIAEISEGAPKMLVGAGSIRTMEQFDACVSAGAQFAVSPGATEILIQHAPLPFVPGAATPSECLRLLEAGYTFQKFFPAEQNGGTKTLKAWAGPLPEVQFCPTGGIAEHNAREYLQLPNVACIGGSWFAPKKLISTGDFAAISEMAEAAVALTT